MTLFKYAGHHQATWFGQCAREQSGRSNERCIRDGTFLSGHCRLQSGALLLLQGQQRGREQEVTGTAWDMLTEPRGVLLLLHMLQQTSERN